MSNPPTIEQLPETHKVEEVQTQEVNEDKFPSDLDNLSKEEFDKWFYYADTCAGKLLKIKPEMMNKLPPAPRVGYGGRYSRFFDRALPSVYEKQDIHMVYDEDF